MTVFRLSFFGIHGALLLQSAAFLSANGDCAAELNESRPDLEAYQLDTLGALKKIFEEQQPCVGGNDLNMKHELKRTKANLTEMEMNFDAGLAGTSFSLL